MIFTLSVAGFGEADSRSAFRAVLSENCTDGDADGYFAEGGCCGEKDCDDADADVYPDAPEKCTDAKDNDCDGVVNEDCYCLAEQLFDQDDAGLETMRRFRDQVLCTSSFGTAMIDLYYAKSDELGVLIEDSPATQRYFKRLFASLIPLMELLLHNYGNPMGTEP